MSRNFHDSDEIQEIESHKDICNFSALCLIRAADAHD